jgi:hypothetical protein
MLGLGGGCHVRRVLLLLRHFFFVLLEIKLLYVLYVLHLIGPS